MPNGLTPKAGTHSEGLSPQGARTKSPLAPVNLSRTLEDGGTITSALIPWNTCGAYMHGVLGVSPLEYMFYAFFNVINPVLAIVYAYLGIKILRLTPPEALLPVVDRPKA